MEFMDLNPDLFSTHTLTLTGYPYPCSCLVLGCVSVELTLLRFCVEPVFAELPEDLLDMLLVESLVLGVDEDVIQVNNNANIKEISEDSINKLLERCMGFG